MPLWIWFVGGRTGSEGSDAEARLKFVMKFLVADDHDLFRDGLKALLKDKYPQAEFFDARTFDEIEQTLAEHGDLSVIFLDLNMPGMGEERIRLLKEARPDLPIIVISGKEQPAEMQRILKMGASGYIPKSVSADITLSAIQLVLSGGTYIPASAVGQRKSNDRISQANVTLLTPRQQDILSLLARGLSNAQIAYELKISEGTVRIHVSNVLRTLNVTNRSQAAVAALRYFGNG